MKLIKIKLINWHIFSNNTIDLRGNTLITGENASGKSTLMDAVYFVLSGGDQNHFNKAANESGKRDLETYVRGKLGSVQKEYLRPEANVIGYIILEYEDDKTKHHQLLGCEIEVASSYREKTHFFIVDNYTIHDDDYIVDRKVIEFSQLKKNFKAASIQLQDLNTSKAEIRRTITNFFKLKNSKRYFELLQNAICFRPIGEVSSFVNSFLLQEDNINLDSLREEIRSYQEIHKLVLKEQEKINCLKPFVPKAEKYLQNLEDITYFNALKTKSQIEKIDNRIKDNNIDLNRKKSEVEQLVLEEEILTSTKDRLIIEISQLENNEIYHALKEKKNLLSTSTDKLDTCKKEMQSFEEGVREEQRISRKLKFNYRFDEDLRSKDYGILRAHLENYNESLSKLGEDTRNEKAHLEIQKEKHIEKKKGIISDLSDLRKGINNYPSYVKTLISIAKEEISKANPNEKNPDVRPLCEHIEILETKWTNALEGYLNTQRFNIVVEPKYYDVVAKAYDKYKHERKVYGVGVVNVNGIPEKEIQEHSMMEKISVHNRHAEKYARHLLGKVICVENVEQLRQFDSSITPEVMIYKNYVLHACNPEIYKTPYIGQSSITKRISILESNLNEETEIIEQTTNQIEQNKNIIETIRNSKIALLLKKENMWAIVDRLEKSVDELQKEIAEDQKDQGLLEITTKLNSADIRLNNVKQQQKINSLKKDSSNKEIGKLESTAIELANNRNELNQTLKNEILHIDNTKYQKMYDIYSKNKRLDEGKIIADFESAQKQNNANNSGLIEIMQDYSRQYKQSLSPIIENLSDFINEYYELENRGIVKYQREAKEAYERAEMSFKEDFISKLREKITKSQNDLDKINKNLSLHPFGNDEEKYKFYYEPTKDSEFYHYYRIITSNKEFLSDNLFSEVLDSKDAAFMKELFDKISMEVNSEKAEAELRRYLDYRNYMSYDIKITNKYGRESYFSKISREKSGGETQTPFYIVIASCFDELMNKDRSKPESTCQVMFDEAFNNMDEGRIQSLMEFYKQLNIQVIIIVPSNRISAISPYMDTLIGIAKINDRPQIFDIGKTS